MSLQEYREMHLRLMRAGDIRWADELLEDAMDEGYTWEQLLDIEDEDCEIIEDVEEEIT